MLAKWFMATLVSWLMKQIFIATVLPWFEDMLARWRGVSRGLYEGFRDGMGKGAKTIAKVATEATDVAVEGVLA